jgi:hypothetical protein
VRRRNGDLGRSGTHYAKRLFLAQRLLYCAGEADGAGEALVTLAPGLGAELGEDSVLALGAGEALASAAGDADADGLAEAEGAAEVAGVADAAAPAEAVALPEACGDVDAAGETEA